MFEFLKMAIASHTYTDLNAMTAKVDKAWAMSAITDDERTELIAMLRAEQPRFDIDVQDEIARLWAAVHALEARPVANEAEPAEPEIKPWEPPTGAHDAYNIGDRVLYNGIVYESLMNGNAYSPDVYPAGWKVVE